MGEAAMQVSSPRPPRRGELLPGTDTDRLATALLTSLQGGLLLAKTFRDGGPLETALHIVIDHIESFTTATTSRRA
jgi:TetR/AcrR family transcriptional repressor of nem operon